MIVPKITANKTCGTLFIFGAFVILNVGFGRLLKVSSEISKYWNIKKVYFIPVFGILGFVLAAIPLFDYWLNHGTNEITLNTFKVTSLLIILAIVSWEELWFRGLFLNYAARYIGKIPIAFFCGFLFMVLHAFNPDINLFIRV